MEHVQYLQFTLSDQRVWGHCCIFFNHMMSALLRWNCRFIYLFCHQLSMEHHQLTRINTQFHNWWLDLFWARTKARSLCLQVTIRDCHDRDMNPGCHGCVLNTLLLHFFAILPNAVLTHGLSLQKAWQLIHSSDYSIHLGTFPNALFTYGGSVSIFILACFTW